MQPFLIDYNLNTKYLIMKNLLITVLALILLGLSCKKDNYSTRPTTLVKTKWILSFIKDTKSNEIINYPSDAKNKIIISFSDSLNILYFGGVCNGGQGKYSYSITDGSIKITDLGTTLIACKYIEWEEYVSSNLYDAFKYNTNGDNIEIDSKGTYNLFFIKTQY